MKIKVTSKASEMIKRTINEKKHGPNVRIYISGMGWGGPSFSIALDEQKDNDYVEEYNEVNYMIEKDILKQFGGFEIDYVKGFLTKGFKVRPIHGGSSCS